jgi:hypothetical protein
MVSALETHLLLFGTPTRMISDRGTNFTDKKVRDLLNGLKIEHHLHLLIGADTNVPQVQSLVDSVPQNVIKIDLRQDRDLAYERLRVNARTQKQRFDKARRDNKNLCRRHIRVSPTTKSQDGQVGPQVRGTV